jgi:hypothetical protein
MKLIKFSLIFLFTLCFSSSYCQEDSIISRETISSNLKFAYNSSLIYPGARIGIESPITKSYITKLLKKGDKKEIVRDQFLAANLSWYHHSDFHDNLYFTVGWTVRRSRSNGYFTEFSPEIGYSRTFLGGTTYKVNDNGDISIEKHAGYNYALVSLGGGIGYDFSVLKSKPFLVLYKINLLTMFPYNSTIYMRPAMELDLIYKPSHFLSYKVRTKKISK